MSKCLWLLLLVSYPTMISRRSESSNYKLGRLKEIQIPTLSKQRLTTESGPHLVLVAPLGYAELQVIWKTSTFKASASPPASPAQGAHREGGIDEPGSTRLHEPCSTHLLISLQLTKSSTSFMLYLFNLYLNILQIICQNAYGYYSWCHTQLVGLS